MLISSQPVQLFLKNLLNDMECLIEEGYISNQGEWKDYRNKLKVFIEASLNEEDEVHWKLEEVHSEIKNLYGCSISDPKLFSVHLKDRIYNVLHQGLGNLLKLIETPTDQTALDKSKQIFYNS